MRIRVSFLLVLAAVTAVLATAWYDPFGVAARTAPAPIPAHHVRAFVPMPWRMVGHPARVPGALGSTEAGLPWGGPMRDHPPAAVAQPPVGEESDPSAPYALSGPPPWALYYARTARSGDPAVNSLPRMVRLRAQQQRVHR